MSEGDTNGNDGPRWVRPITGPVSYIQSLDWAEPWLYGLIALYVLLFAGIHRTRRNSTVQSFLFVFLLLVIYVAEDLNEYLAKNHKAFTRHQYFDSNGIFISVVMSVPLLLACSLIVANWFKVSTELMVQMTRLKAKRGRRDAAAVAQDDDDKEKKS